MEIKDIRRENFRFLCDTKGRSIVSQKMGYSDNGYINQLYAGHGSFGGRTARRVEKAFNLDSGWMDVRHPGASGVPEEQGEIPAETVLQIAERLHRLGPENLPALEAFLDSLESRTRRKPD